jgi:hypothetical protein
MSKLRPTLRSNVVFSLQGSKGPRHSTAKDEDIRLPETSGSHDPWCRVISEKMDCSAISLQKLQTLYDRSCLGDSKVAFNDSTNLSATALKYENSWQHRANWLMWIKKKSTKIRRRRTIQDDRQEEWKWDFANFLSNSEQYAKKSLKFTKILWLTFYCNRNENVVLCETRPARLLFPG